MSRGEMCSVTRCTSYPPDSVQPYLRRVLRELLATLGEILSPTHCPACGVVCGGGLCPGCRQRLSIRPPPRCPRCGAGLIAAGDPCRQEHRHLRGIALARAPFQYAGTAGEVVRRGKFQRDMGSLSWLARAMAGCLADWARAEGRRAVVVSVPLHPSKRRQRGVDQAAVLAGLVARRLGLVHGAGVLARCRETLAQGDVRVTSREKNVAGAFRVRRPLLVGGKTVVLVDDVTTSGSTARECARVLSAAGAREIVLLTAAAARDQ